MDLIKVENVKANDVADGRLNADLQTQRKVNSFAALKDWEMVLASGGEGAPSW